MQMLREGDREGLEAPFCLTTTSHDEQCLRQAEATSHLTTTLDDAKMREGVALGKAVGKCIAPSTVLLQQMKNSLSQKTALSPGNPFEHWIMPNGGILWRCNAPCNAKDVREVVHVTTSKDRNILMNTGGHGSQDGGDPTSASNGEFVFTEQDMTTIKSAPLPGHVSIHIVSPYAPPVYPPDAIDIIDAWCYSGSPMALPYRVTVSLVEAAAAAAAKNAAAEEEDARRKAEEAEKKKAKDIKRGEKEQEKERAAKQREDMEVKRKTAEAKKETEEAAAVAREEEKKLRFAAEVAKKRYICWMLICALMAAALFFMQRKNLSSPLALDTIREVAKTAPRLS